jgi:murein L,D-transpeptidase YafK
MNLFSQNRRTILCFTGIFAFVWLSGYAGSRLAAKPAAKVDRIVIEKQNRTLSLMAGAKILKTYKVALGGQPVGAKNRQGDHKTPEGIYSVDAKNPNSQFYKALHISYPNQADRENARQLGVRPGGDVEIHGLGAKWGWIGAKHRLTDWTDGCIAVTNEEIDEIYPQIQVGTPVEIRP